MVVYYILIHLILGLLTAISVTATTIAYRKYRRFIKLIPRYVLGSYIRNRPMRSSVVGLYTTRLQESGVGVRRFKSSSIEVPEALETPYKKGDFIGTKYEVYGLLGAGGFGVVYLVYDHETKNVLALKTFRDEYLNDAEMRALFLREAETWVRLERHAYLVRAYWVDEISGRLYIAMEYIAPDKKGGMNSLEGYLKQCPPDLAQSLRWAIQFCHGMEYAYSRGIICHRDIKPDNIMISHDKTIKISDFGLAGVLDESIVGTPLYMSPERFTNPKGCDERSDIYNFGIVLYQMVADNHLPPFLADSLTEIYKLHCKSPVPELRSPLFPIIQRCLEKKPDNRYQTFEELRGDLEYLLKKETGEVIKPPDRIELEAWELVNKGASLTRIGRFDEAICSFDSALKIDPELAVAWNNRGSASCKKGEYDRAILDYDKALEINPRYAEAYNNRGETYFRKGEYDSAILDFNRGFEINPRFAEAYYNRGTAYNRKGEYDRAILDYDKALEINPRYDGAYNNRGFAYDNKGDHDRAILDYDKALEINPRLTSAWNNKGDSLVSLGRDEEAIKCYEKAIELDPKSVSAWYKKGLVKDTIGRRQEAIHAYKQFIELGRLKQTRYEKQIQSAQQRLKVLEGTTK